MERKAYPSFPFRFPVLTNFAQDGGIEEVMKLTKDTMAKLL